MPLAMVKSGENVVIKTINWGPKLKKKLQDMGLTQGVKISVISNDSNGAYILNVRDSRLVLGGVVTQQILVDVV